MLRRGGCEGRGGEESMRSEHVRGGGVGGGGAGGTGRGDACWWVGEARSPLRQAGQFQPVGEPAVQILQKSARVREEQEKCTHLEQVEHFRESFLTSREHMELGNVGGPEVDVIDKSLALLGGTLGEGVEGTQAS